MRTRRPPICSGPPICNGIVARRCMWLVPLLTSACHPAILDPAGPIGVADRAILIDSLAIMLAIVVPTIIATFGFAWWFRAGNPRATHRPSFAYSGRIELVVWAVPVLVVTLLGGVAWVGSHDLDPAAPIASPDEPIEIQAVALDWKWLFIYPRQRIATVNQLTIPTGQPVHFSITSDSVMNAFFIPRLGSMIYAMYGMTTGLNLQADQPGSYRGISAQFSGDGFSDMNFQAHAIPPDEFAAWVKTASAQPGTLDGASFANLQKPSQNDPPSGFGHIDPSLFNRIVMQNLPPAAGPTAEPAPTPTPGTQK